MPFIILIAVGIIAVLIFNLWKILFVKDNQDGVFMHIVDGSAQLRTWGTDDFFDLSADALVVQGDEVRTSSEGRVVFEFFDGTVMRIDGGSDVIFEVVEEGKDGPELRVILVDGSAWVNKVYKDTANTNLVVTMNNVTVTSDSAHIFELENKFDEAVRVFSGSDLQVDVLMETEKKIVETEKLGVGQEILFTDQVLSRFWEYQSPTVIAPLSDEFKQSSWYIWNIEQDENPQEINKTIADPNNTLVSAPPEVLETENPEDQEVEQAPAPEEVSESGPNKPTISSVAGITQTDENGVYHTTSRVATLAGTVSGASQIIVNDYTLTQFSPGDSSWSYFANADFGLMVPGENTYTVYAVDADGNKSAPLIFKVYYTPQTPVAPASAEDVESTESTEDI